MTWWTVLGWVAGTPLAINVTHGTLMIGTDPCGVFGITSHGHLRL